MRSLVSVLSVVVLFLSATTAWAAIKVQTIEYVHAGTALRGVLAYDDAVPENEKRPGVLVCHEWWGCNDYAEARARKLAEKGYVAFALDMYGKDNTTSDPKQAGAWAGALFADPKAARERAAAGLAVLAGNARVDKNQLAAIGYCMGGTVALELARSGLEYTENLKAVVCFHTSTLAAKGDAKVADEQNTRIKASVLICHGAADTFVTAEEISGFKSQMTSAKADYQFIEYSGAVHSFTNPNADRYNVPGVKHNANADARSWASTLALFAEVFAKRKPEAAPKTEPVKK